MAVTAKHRMLQVMLVVVTLIILGIAVQIQAGETPSIAEHSDIVWQMIVGLFGLLNTILMGVIIWIINNQSSIFRRLGKAEAALQTNAALCDERHGDHPHRRRSDGN